MFAVTFPNNVLVCDDEPVIRTMISKVFSKTGIEAIAVGTAEEALATIEQRPIACLLTDKNLPGIDGIELMRRTVEVAPYTACIMMTGYASQTSAIEALQLGALDYLVKPIDDILIVRAKVEAAIDRMRTRYERDHLVAQVRQFQSALSEKEAEAFAQQTELQILNELVEDRVREATRDLEAKCAMLEYLHESDPVDPVIIRHTESLLLELKTAPLGTDDPVGSALNMVARVRRQLEANLALLKRGKS